MCFFTPKNKSDDNASIKNLMSVNSQRNLENFLEAEKNMFGQINSFISVFFLLNSGLLAALLQFKSDMTLCIILLSFGITLALFSYLISVLMLNRSMSHMIKDNIQSFKLNRRQSYSFSYFGLSASIISFLITMVYFIIKILKHIEIKPVTIIYVYTITHIYCNLSVMSHSIYKYFIISLFFIIFTFVNNKWTITRNGITPSHI